MVSLDREGPSLVNVSQFAVFWPQFATQVLQGINYQMFTLC